MDSSHIPRLLILDPYVAGVRGHNWQSILHIIKAAQPCLATVVVRESADKSLSASGVDVRALFAPAELEAFKVGPRPKGNVAGYANKLARSFSRRLRLAQWFFAEKWGVRALRPDEWPRLDRLLDTVNVLAADHIVLPTAPPSLIIALKKALLARKATTHIHAQIIDLQSPRKSKDLGRLSSELVKEPLLRDNIYFYVETPTGQRFMRERYGIEADCLPYVLDAPDPETVEDRPDPRPMVFGFLGPSREEKGFGRLLTMMTKVASAPGYDRRRVAFNIQLEATSRHSILLARELVGGARTLDLDVRFHEGPLSSERYKALFESTHCLLLPYVGSRYETSGSGIVFEAVAHGKPFIYSAGLSFGDFGGAGNGIEAADDQAFANAIIRIAEDPRSCLEAARASAREYREALSANPLLKRLRSTVQRGTGDVDSLQAYGTGAP